MKYNIQDNVLQKRETDARRTANAYSSPSVMTTDDEEKQNKYRLRKVGVCAELTGKTLPSPGTNSTPNIYIKCVQAALKGVLLFILVSMGRVLFELIQSETISLCLYPMCSEEVHTLPPESLSPPSTSSSPPSASHVVNVLHNSTSTRPIRPSFTIVKILKDDDHPNLRTGLGRTRVPNLVTGVVPPNVSITSKIKSAIELTLILLNTAADATYHSCQTNDASALMIDEEFHVNKNRRHLRVETNTCEWLNRSVKLLRQCVVHMRIICDFKADPNNDPNTIAYVKRWDFFVGLAGSNAAKIYSPIHLTRRFFETPDNKGGREMRARTLLHECAHTQLDAEDYAYAHEAHKYRSLSSHAAMGNADTFASVIWKLAKRRERGPEHRSSAW